MLIKKRVAKLYYSLAFDVQDIVTANICKHRLWKQLPRKKKMQRKLCSLMLIDFFSFCFLMCQIQGDNREQELLDHKIIDQWETGGGPVQPNHLNEF